MTSFNKRLMMSKKLLKSSNVDIYMLPLSNSVINFNRSSQNKLPESVLETIHSMNGYSPRIYPPFKGCGMQYGYYHKIIDNAYATLSLAVGNDCGYDGVILIPRIRTGGTDKLLKSYLSVLSGKMNLNILIVCEDSSRCEWSELFEDFATVLYLDKIYAKNMPKHIQIAAIHMVLKFIKPKFVWGFNSRLAYMLFCTYGKTLKSDMDLWVVVFAHWIHEVSYREFGMIHDYFPRMKDHLSYVIADNNKFVNTLIAQYNLNKTKIGCIPSPNSLTEVEFLPRIKRSKLRILWASGIEWNKGLETLAKIARELDVQQIPVEIDVFGRPKNNEGVKLLEWFKKETLDLKTVSYKGGFSNFDALKPGDYDGFLFTSMIEGMPNILLEAAENQMYIISSLVGGVGDLVQHQNTGSLIENCFEVSAYVESIKQLCAMNSEDYNQIRQNLVKHYNSHYVANIAEERFRQIIG